jgi:peptidoglycan/LPS O-acetylase OafA/YrhL
VVLFHAGLGHVVGGFIGVDVFFVLSGFLVGSVIITEYSRTGRIALVAFYARRVRRLLPAGLVAIVGVSAASILVEPRLAREGFIDDARSSLLYSANWHFLGDATNYFATEVDRSPFLHFWSLAIEEQFYIVFPVLLLGLLTAAARTRRPCIVPVGLSIAMCLSIVAQVTFAADDPLRAYYGTDTRFYQLLAGTTLAATLHHVRTSATFAVNVGSTRFRSLAQRYAGLGAACALVLLVLAASDGFEVEPSARGLTATALTVAIIIGLEIAPTGRLGRVLSRDTLTYLGRISYGTYLWHWPIVVLAAPVLDLSPLQLAAVAGVGGTALAALSFQLIESPIRTSKFVMRRPGALVLCGLSMSVLAAVVVAPGLLRSNERPAFVQRSPIAGPTPVSPEQARQLESLLQTVAPTLIDLTPTQLTPVDQTACTTEQPNGCVVHQGSNFHMMLLGDSNAEMLIAAFTELAAQYDFTLSVSTRLGCPWQIGLLWAADDQRLLDECASGRLGWYDQIVPALDPDVIVLASAPRDPGSRPDAFFQPEDGALGNRSLNEVIAEATESSLIRLTATGARVVILEPLPYADFDPNVCLSGAVTVADCAYRTPDVPFPTERIYRDQAVASTSVFSLDYDRVACPFLPTCVPLIDGDLVFRNEFHLSEQWIDMHIDELWNTLTDSGAIPT